MAPGLLAQGDQVAVTVEAFEVNDSAFEIETLRDTQPDFTGQISDLGGPTANMYRLHCKDKAIESACRRLSCVYPGICKNLNTDHRHLISLYRKARSIPGIKRVHIASGLRYDLAVESPEYIEELVTHHVGGYLKIAPEHTEQGPLSKMMKPGIGSYHRFKELFDRFSKKAGKEQYLITYFISAHPGTSDTDMLNLALFHLLMTPAIIALGIGEAGILLPLALSLLAAMGAAITVGLRKGGLLI
jgi:uncharacterized radical SAM protein YgiQ